jgi:hypothetical protein
VQLVKHYSPKSEYVRLKINLRGFDLSDVLLLVQGLQLDESKIIYNFGLHNGSLNNFNKKHIAIY